MKVHYDENEDILMIELSRGKIDDTYEVDNGLVSVSDKGKPLLIEIFKASEFFENESKVLPREIKQKFFANF